MYCYKRPAGLVLQAQRTRIVALRSSLSVTHFLNFNMFSPLVVEWEITVCRIDLNHHGAYVHGMRVITGLAEIASDYDAILCDVWGVIHNGRAAFEPACEALVQFRAGGGRVILITNAPVPSQQVLDYMKPLNIPAEAFDACVSSGDATREVLRQNADKVLWTLGNDSDWEHDRYLYDGLDLERADTPDKAGLGLLIGMRDMRADHPEDYRGELAGIAKSGLELVCANPDIQVRIGDKLHWCAGALAQIYEQEGGQVLYPGKPYSAIYDLAFEKLNEVGLAVDKARVLAIGDSPKTDMRGAAGQGIDALYVGTGLAKHGAGSARFEDEVRALLNEYETHATFAQPGLVW